MPMIYKMKKILSLLIFLISTISYSQDIYDLLAKETCECLSAKKLDLTNLPPNGLQTEFVACFFKSYAAHNSEVDKLEKLDLTDEEKMSKFGERIAIKMVNHCPDIILALGTAYNEEQGAGAQEELLTMEGEVVEIKTEQFVTIQVKDKNARIHNFILLNYFETASMFTDNQIAKKNKITVSYSEIELFDPKVKEFRYFKVIAGLQKK